MREITIDKYLRNLLSEEEKRLFEQELKNDPALMEEFTKYQKAYQALLLGNERTLRLKMQQWKEELAPPADRVHARNIYLYLAAGLVAACILLLIIFFPQTKTPDTLFKENFTALNISSSRSLPPNQDSPLSKMAERYNRKNYETLLREYHSLGKDSDIYTKDMASLYLGVSYLHLNKSTQAVRYLKNVSNQSDPELYVHAQWYLALAQLQSNQIQAAKTSFQKITQDTRHLYYPKARKILNDLP
ncbi:MAG: hypothetical protein NW226_15470 [Microscillaceae bacterium]|nr:hypothetical protein [Microscillaceae bacterium]